MKKPPRNFNNDSVDNQECRNENGMGKEHDDRDAENKTTTRRQEAKANWTYQNGGQVRS